MMIKKKFFNREIIRGDIGVSCNIFALIIYNFNIMPHVGRHF
jgi:hypothetical protein